MDKHEVICLLKDAAIGLGRTPTRDEFRALCSEKKVRKLFGTYSALIQASGLDAVKPSKKTKFPNLATPELITESITEHSSKRIIRLPSYRKIVVIGDCHKPFVSADALSMVYTIIEKEQPDVVIQVGDLYDLYAQSRFPRSLNLMTPEAEETLARNMAIEMWATIKKLVPNANCFQLCGNHDIRPLKNVQAKWPEGEHWVKKEYISRMTFEGVKTIYDPTEELIIDDIVVIHGYLSGLGSHRDYNQSNVICGHSHRGGVSYRPLKEKVLWELNAGLIGDPYSKALSYRPQRLHAWTLGIGIVDELGPRFVHF